jgi:hypothetical protein
MDFELLADGDGDIDSVREGAKDSTGVVGVEEDDFLKLGTENDTATPKAKNAKARETIAIVRDSLDGFSSFLLIGKPSPEFIRFDQKRMKDERRTQWDASPRISRPEKNPRSLHPSLPSPKFRIGVDFILHITNFD